jgi:hypothetical protein
MISDPQVGPILKDLKLNTPARTELTGLSIDIRLRKGGSDVDMVFAGRWMAPVLLALQEAFDKPLVPKGSVVIANDEKSTCRVLFCCHDDNDEVIRPETAKFDIPMVQYLHPESGEVPTLSSVEIREYALMPPGQLWNSKGLIRQISIKFFFPPEMLANMIHTVRERVSSRDNNFDEVPMIIEWPDKFVGTQGLSGFNERLRDDLISVTNANNNLQLKHKFRFVCAGRNYFDDEVFLDDDGDMVSYST